MINILYAASNRTSSQIQLYRFINAIDKSKFNVKIAAYKSSTPIGVNVDWTLDCLHGLFKLNSVNINSESFEIYFDQVKQFNPKLIISDLEYFSSYIAKTLNIPLWQYSSSLIKYSLSHEQKYSSGLYNKFSYLFEKSVADDHVHHMIDISDHNFVCSHLADIGFLKLKDKFEFVRPYYITGKRSSLYEHNIVASTLSPNKKIINLLKKYEDCILFSEFCEEYYDNISLKEIRDVDEYSCNICNCNLLICEGQTSFLADAFYNEKFSIIFPDFNDSECIINSCFSERFGLSKTIYNPLSEGINYLKNKSIEYSFDSNVKFLHERIIDELYCA